MRNLVSTAVFAGIISLSIGSAGAQNAVRLPAPYAPTYSATQKIPATPATTAAAIQHTSAVATPGAPIQPAAIQTDLPQPDLIQPTPIQPALIQPTPIQPSAIETVAFGAPVDTSTASLQRIASLEAEVASLRQRLDTSAVVDRVNPGWSASLDYLNWTLKRRGLDFAIPTTDTALSVGVGEVRSLNFGQDSGFRTSLGYLTPNGWETTFRYTSFDTNATAMADDTLGNLWATRTHPDRNEEAETAEAFGSFDYDVFDLELQRWLVLSPSTGLAVFGGFRWADISQNFRADYDGQDFSDATFQNLVDMTGFGIRIGGEGHWRITNYLSLFGRAAGTVMQGEFNSRLFETDFSGVDVIVDVTNEYSETLTAIELATGIALQNGPVAVSAGYEMTEWSNLGDRSRFSSDTHEGAYAPSSVDILLEGLFLRGSLAF